MQKLYYSISEICTIIGEEAHVLRYWEKEFGKLKPKKNRAGNRVYSAKDLELLQRIKHYLREDKLSLKGAREKLDAFVAGKEEQSPVGQPAKAAPIAAIETKAAESVAAPNSELKELLQDILNYLKNE